MKIVDYMKKYLSALYLQYIEKDGKLCLQLDRNIDISKQVVEHDCPAPNFRDFRKCGEVHIFNDCSIILLVQHTIADDDAVKNTPRELELPDQIPDIFKEEIESHQKKREQGAYEPKYLNKYEVNDDFYDDVVLETIDIDMNNCPQLQHKFTQKLIIMNSLLKLYILKKQGRISNIEKLLDDGIAFMQQYITDARKFTTKQWKFGSCYLAFDDNYLIKSNDKISELVQQLVKSMKELQENQEQYSFIQHHINMNKAQPMKKNCNVIHSIFFSNAGKFPEYNMFKKINFDCINNKDQIVSMMSFLQSFRNVITISYHSIKQFIPYHIIDVLNILIDNIRDDMTVGELWNTIKDF